MSTKVTINGNTYKVPNAGEPAGWGEDTTGVILDLITVVNALTGADFISESTANLDVTQITLADISGLVFRKDYTRSVSIKYIIKVNATDFLVEEGALHIVYDDGEATWKMQRDFTGDNSKITLSITNNGQIQYKTPGAISYPGISGITLYYKTDSLVSVVTE